MEDKILERNWDLLKEVKESLSVWNWKNSIQKARLLKTVSYLIDVQCEFIELIALVNKDSK